MISQVNEQNDGCKNTLFSVIQPVNDLAKKSITNIFNLLKPRHITLCRLNLFMLNFDEEYVAHLTMM